MSAGVTVATSIVVMPIEGFSTWPLYGGTAISTCEREELDCMHHAVDLIAIAIWLADVLESRRA